MQLSRSGPSERIAATLLRIVATLGLVLLGGYLAYTFLYASTGVSGLHGVPSRLHQYQTARLVQTLSAVLLVVVLVLGGKVLQGFFRKPSAREGATALATEFGVTPVFDGVPDEGWTEKALRLLIYTAAFGAISTAALIALANASRTFR
jgi:hypothetical protein